MSVPYKPRSRWGILPPRYRTHEQVFSVTTAHSGRSKDLTHRQIQYWVAMSIRLVCFILAVAVPYGWFTWVFIAGAVFLPYVAVILANASGDQREQGLERPEHEIPHLTEPTVYRLPPGRHHGGSTHGTSH